MASIIFVTPVAAYQTGVSINAPESVDSDFSVVIEIENAVDLDSGQFDLSFDPDAVNVTGVDDGNIGGTVVPVDNWALMGENTIRVIVNRPGIDGVSGSGSLATIRFETIVPGDCTMELSGGLLVDTMAEVISASWNDAESAVSKTETSIPADATESETPGFVAISTIGLLAAAIFAFRRE
ncbi:MAG: cohesin domain-containing protein [Candidatus Methanogasteraceae archaeon]